MDILTQNIFLSVGLFVCITIFGICFAMPAKYEDGTTTIARSVGWWFVGLSAVLTILQSVVSYYDSKSRDREIDEAIAKGKQEFRSHSDSTVAVIREEYEKTTEELRKSDSIRFSILGDAVGKHGYKVDSASRSLMKAFGDSTFTIFPYTHICEPSPITISTVDKWKYAFQIQICNANAPARDVDIKMLLAASIRDSIIFIGEGMLLSGDNLGQNSGYGIEGNFSTNFDFEKTYWIFRITYKTLDKRRNFDREEFFTVQGNSASAVAQKTVRNEISQRIEKDRQRKANNNFNFTKPFQQVKQ